MSQLTITCPSCNETFSADQALQNHLKSKEKEYQEEIARESKPLLKKMRELKAEGYSNDDISKIICGANKKDFTPENK